MTILQMVIMLSIFCRALGVPGRPVLEFECSNGRELKMSFNHDL